MKPLFGQGASLIRRFVFFVLLSLLCIIADRRWEAFSVVRSGLDSLLSPIQYLSSAPRHVLWSLSHWMKNHTTLLQENKALERQLFLLQSELLQFEHLKRDNARLHQLLGSPVHQDAKKMIARILSVATDPSSHQIVINKGSIDGVFQGQPVINEQGVVGQVLHVGTVTSHVLLITDSTHGIPVRIARTDIRAIASGTGDLHRLELHHLPRSAGVEVGDLLVSSGLGGLFPEGYPVAKISRFNTVEGKPFAEIDAQLLAALDKLRYVLLLWPQTQSVVDEMEW